jgi:hypothetical protein
MSIGKINKLIVPNNTKQIPYTTPIESRCLNPTHLLSMENICNLSHIEITRNLLVLD